MALQQCPRCGKVFERNFSASPAPINCPACDQQLSQTVRTSLPSFQPTISPAAFLVTIGLIAASVLVFAVMVFSGVSAIDPTPGQAIAFGADYGPLTLGGQWWRLVTSMFVHFGFIHLGLNMWCLWNLGRAAERLLGRFCYLLAYFASGIFGSIASVYWHPQAAGAGASGAIFGLAGVLVSFVYLKKTPAHLQLNKNVLGSLGTFIAYNLIFGAAIPGISLAAHVGGLVMGLFVGALLPSAAASESARRARLSFVVAITAIALIASAVATKRLSAGTSELSAIQHLLSDGKSEEAIAQLKALTDREPGFAPAQALLSSIYIQQRHYPEALAALQRAYQADPANAAYQQHLGAAYLTMGQFDQALAFYQKLTVQNPRDSRAFLGVGYSYIGLKQPDTAISAFRQAATLDPKSPTPQYALGQAQLQAGRFADAQTTYRQLVAQFPDDPRAQAALDYATRQIH
jgi:rhomboid protease GluP